MWQNDLQLKSGVFGGTLLSAVLNFSLHDVFFTVVMAIIGAVVSFFVSYILKRLFSDKK
ncbi:hypothetical protein [Lutibacter sp.]